MLCRMIIRRTCHDLKIRRREGYAAAELYQHNRHRTLCVTTPVHVIGDVEHVGVPSPTPQPRMSLTDMTSTRFRLGSGVRHVHTDYKDEHSGHGLSFE